MTKKILNNSFFLRKLLNFSYYIFYLFVLLIFFEVLIRILVFFPTNSDVFKYGFKKSVIFDVVDLSRLQIVVFDKQKDVKKNKLTNIKDEKVWVFGGSTTEGSGCEGSYSSSWPIELSKINKNFKFRNFAFGGAFTDNQINLLYQNIDGNVPDVIMWANKFNAIRITGSKDYRNKNILKYDFVHSTKTKFIMNIKTLDKTLKSYFLSYAFLDKIVTRIRIILQKSKTNSQLQLIKVYKIEPTKKDITYALENFKLNTIEAIELSKKFGVKEFYIVSLLSSYDFVGDKLEIKLYYDKINEIEKIYYPFVKIINSNLDTDNYNMNELFCDPIHQTRKMNILQAEMINKQLLNFSELLIK
tara:strand:+ start:137 stop:1207 length:1071 start_codon:yes stop_codon:yes gene_type:complete